LNLYSEGFNKTTEMEYSRVSAMCKGRSVSQDGSVGIATTIRVGRSGNRVSVEAKYSLAVQPAPRSDVESFTGVKRPAR
jgi:hypothetical protein